MDKEYLKNFKDGVSDALLEGIRSDDRPSGYNHGYDFGIAVYSETLEIEDTQEEVTNA